MMKTNRKSGFSLIEIMVASLLLAVLAVGGAAVFHQTGAGIQIYGNKRVAMEYARSWIETSKDVDYFVLRGRAADAPVSLSTTVNGVVLTTISDITLHGDPGGDGVYGPLGNEYLELEVEVQYGRSADEKVEMNTTKVLL